MSEELGVRLGVPDDVHSMMDLAMQACDENGFVDPNPQKLLTEIWPALNLDNGLVGIIQDDGGVLEGAILLRIGNMWYSDEKVLEEKAIFIHPDYRNAKGGRARRLCEFSKQVANTLELPLIIGVLSNHRTEAKVRLYERQFGKPTGAFFLYNARTGSQKEAAT
jgi:hypothetical protein